MKIIIEANNRKYTVETEHDDLSWPKLLDDFIFPLLKAMQYSLNRQQRAEVRDEVKTFEKFKK